MMMQVIIKPAANEEFIAAAKWYESRKSGLGDTFTKAIQTLVARICEQPTSFPIVAKDVHQAIERQFPFSVLYRIRDNHVVIIAIFHASRDPQSWQDRV